MPYRKALLLACAAMAVLAKGAAPPPVETLEEVAVHGTKDRERERGPLAESDETGYFLYLVRRDIETRFEVAFVTIRGAEVSFRRESRARRLLARQGPASPVRLKGDLLAGFDRLNTKAVLSLDDNVEEADGIPASIPFGTHAALVNLEHLRLRDTRFQTHVTVVNGIDPQRRRCEEKFALLDDDRDGSGRFILVAETIAHCRRAQRGREGDLVFADHVPETLRQAVKDVYGPIAVRFGNKLGSEPGLIFVAWWPDSPHGDFRFERSWNRNSLLLFNGTTWQGGLSSLQREVLWSTFATEQVQRRFRRSERPGPLTEAAASYLLMLATAERNHATNRWLSDALPGWITECAARQHDRAQRIALPGELPGGECGLLVQFVYDATARSRSEGRETLYDSWRRLLNASFRRGESGATPADFLASSDEARLIVQGLLDGAIDWERLAVALHDLGVRLDVEYSAGVTSASVLELKYFRD